MGASDDRLMKCINQCTIKDRELFEARKRNEELTKQMVALQEACSIFKERALTFETKLHMLQVLFIENRNEAFSF